MSRKYLILGGMNEFEVYATNWNSVDGKAFKCDWLGHSRFKCGKCRKGYFAVRSPYDHDEKCRECEAYISVRAITEMKEES
jgi:hypothetical protein